MKKTIITSIAVSLCALTAVFCFTACGNANNSSSNTKTTSATEEAKSSLVGTWESVEAAGTSYTFNEDGTGAINGVGYSTPFKYTDNGSTIEFTYDGAAADMKSDYKIEGDTLSITNDDSNTLTYKKTDGTPKATESTAKAQPDSALLGTWQSDEDDATITYNEDGTGTIKSKATETTFTFEDKGSTVDVSIANTETQTSSYVIDGSKLTMTAADGTVSHFTKK